jgi:hypothetical protein
MGNEGYPAERTGAIAKPPGVACSPREADGMHRSRSLARAVRSKRWRTQPPWSLEHWGRHRRDVATVRNPVLPIDESGVLEERAALRYRLQ